MYVCMYICMSVCVCVCVCVYPYCVAQEYMQCVTVVDGEWLAELGPMFFSVKESIRTRQVCGSLEQTSPCCLVCFHQEKKAVMREKQSEMEAKLEAASEELRERREQEKEQLKLSIRSGTASCHSVCVCVGGREEGGGLLACVVDHMVFSSLVHHLHSCFL